MRRLLPGALFATLLITLGFTGSVLAQNMEIPYTRMYTDAEGVSHFEDGVMDMSVFPLAGAEAGMATFMVQNQANVMAIPPGMEEDWHPSPNPQLMVVVQGVSEVQVSDGEIRQFGPGAVLIMEDTGKGHTTKTVGDIPHAAMMIPLQRE